MNGNRNESLANLVDSDDGGDNDQDDSEDEDEDKEEDVNLAGGWELCCPGACGELGKETVAGLYLEEDTNI